MNSQEQFINMIQDVVALAKMNQHKVTKEFLQDYLKELKLEEKQLELVYEYLQKENIHVTGYIGSASHEQKTEALTAEIETDESEFLGMYLEEMNHTGSKNEISEYHYEQAIAGNAQAKQYIVEQKLSRVVELAAQFKNQGIAQSDLIQEGNLGLLLAIEMLEEYRENPDEFLDMKIERSMLALLDELHEEKRENHGLMRKAENLKNEMERLSEDFGDKMTSDDVAQFTGMDLDEIQKIIGMTGEDV